jgi:hypothetical protein
LAKLFFIFPIGDLRAINFMDIHLRVETVFPHGVSVLTDLLPIGERAGRSGRYPRNEKARFEQAARVIKDRPRRQALDELFAHMDTKERHCVGERRVLFARRKNLVLEERVLFRNIPLSNWVEGEFQLRKGRISTRLRGPLSFFNQIEGDASAPQSSRGMPLRAS